MRIRLKHDRLAELLAASRLSQNHWALRLGLSRGHLSDLLKGRHPYVSDKTRNKLIEGLGVSFEDLFEEERPRAVDVAASPVPQFRTSSRAQPLSAATLTFLEDVRYAIRVSMRYRLVTGAVIATMALGIAVTTSVYSIVQAVLLSPLPFPESEAVVRLGMTLRDGRAVNQNALPDIEDYRQHAKTISDISAVQLSGTTITGGDTPEHEMVAYVDHGYDEVFRLQPIYGRFFQADEYTFGAPKVTIVSNRLWRERFASDPTLVGRTISLDHQPVTVIGVLPPMTYMYPWPDLGFISPLRPNPKSFHFNRGALWLRAVARMRPGVTLAQTEQELGAIGAGIAERYPEANGGLHVRLEGLRAGETQDARPMLLLLSVAVATVLLIACVNIANLLLGHSHSRTREFAVRAALGGRTGRLRRQVLTESLTLSSVGGVIGILLAPMLVRALTALYPGRLARLDEIVFDWRVALAGLAVTALAGVLAGVPTARRAAGVNLTRDLRQGGR
ncbi:MAG TPA: ABC transporter permease, partial [Vicinamibacterales bacterium]|nr:ABC transporter permease [Vicinamibacterales bacterium]